jgi:hypothetical protein
MACATVCASGSLVSSAAMVVWGVECEIGNEGARRELSTQYVWQQLWIVAAKTVGLAVDSVVGGSDRARRGWSR